MNMANQPRQFHSSIDDASSGLSVCRQHEAPLSANMGLDAAILLNNCGVALLEMGKFQQANETLRDAFVVWRMGNDASTFPVQKKSTLRGSVCRNKTRRNAPAFQWHNSMSNLYHLQKYQVPVSSIPLSK